MKLREVRKGTEDIECPFCHIPAMVEFDNGEVDEWERVSCPICGNTFDIIVKATVVLEQRPRRSHE